MELLSYRDDWKYKRLMSTRDLQSAYSAANAEPASKECLNAAVEAPPKRNNIFLLLVTPPPTSNYLLILSQDIQTLSEYFKVKYLGRLGPQVTKRQTN